MSHQAQVPVAAAGYGWRQHPIVVQEFQPERGWRITGYKKRISGAWARKLRAAGVTHVALSDGVRTADFTIRELVRR
jgi:hypothetical protein